LQAGLNLVDAGDDGTDFLHVAVVLGTKNRFEQIHHDLPVYRLKIEQIRYATGGAASKGNGGTI
jgi:hypothetical protein